jgi:signal transduction histidine kinase
MAIRDSAQGSTEPAPRATAAWDTAEARALVAALADRLPAPPAAADARRALRRLERSDDLALRHGLPAAYAALVRALAEAGDPDDPAAELRTLVHRRFPTLLREPALAQVVEADARRTGALSWLLRENAGRLELLAGELAGRDAEIDRLRQERERLREENRLLRRELEYAAPRAEVGLMAAGVAHDLNNLLQVVTGVAALARAGRGDTPGALDRIEQAGLRAAELSRRLVGWAADEPCPAALASLNAVAEEVLDLLASSAPERVLLRRALAPGLPDVIGDPCQLRRVVLNLVVNAWHAIGADEGEVVVATGADEGRRPGAWLEVRDSGRGMDEATRDRVFEPFFSTREGGSGLGLATVQRIVESLDGRIEVWSEPGAGARFRVTLPAVTRSGQ